MQSRIVINYTAALNPVDFKMDVEFRKKLVSALVAYNELLGESTSEANHIPKVAYGTAGFRGEVSQIKHLFFKVGLISGLKCLLSKANIGIMVTASHNPIQDNGIKLIESNGDMLVSEWEEIVEEFCNTHDIDAILAQLEQLVQKYELDTSEKCNGQVMIGMDTRPSSESLVALVKRGLDCWQSIVEYLDYGLVTTPVLHYLVAESNKRGSKMEPSAFYAQLSSGVEQIFSISNPSEDALYEPKLVIDCANGVGYVTMQNLSNEPRFSKRLHAKLINTGEGILNKSCGADYVKTKLLAPIEATETNRRYAALDGDADRVVYFYIDSIDNQLKLHLLDGDKIMALFALFLSDMLKAYQLEGQLSLGCVQTAYANGSSTDYLSKVLGIEADFTDTGVKNLHKQASKYDFGVYFEANGHGTIHISEKAKQLIKDNGRECSSFFNNLFQIINNYTGDAISDILVVETILKHYDWNIQKWYELYEDRPNSLMKVQVPDRSIIKTSNAGRTCTSPIGLQEAIQEEVSKFGSEARSFVRPSGTENVVRVYAEAENQELAYSLANSVCKLVEKFCSISANNQ